MKIVFQGDSITDAGRDRNDHHHLGNGYPKFAADHIKEAHPDTDIEFMNFGISGNRTCQLFDRLYAEGIVQQPDVISILIGINDIWHRQANIRTTDEQLVLNYRETLKRLKTETNAKIVMLAPYLLDCSDKEDVRTDLHRILPAIRALAKEYADVYIPLDELFDEAMKTQPEPHYYSGDGVHPNANGAAFIGKLYAEAVASLIS
ncbi:MAG: GDSL family lipase [Clostridia bacterium]|nr:GDSL family lipase [Clostridia bacterium]